MTEPLIAAAESIAGPLIQQAVKDLAPEAEAVLNQVHDFASAEFAKLDDSFPQLLTVAEHDALGALRAAQSHLANVINHVRNILGIPALGQPTDPTPAVPAPPTQS